jgi:hypothetical protein
MSYTVRHYTQGALSVNRKHGHYTDFSIDVVISAVVGFALEYFSSLYYINLMEKKRELMTAREFARRLNIPYTTVAGWLQKGHVPGAEAQIVGTFKVWMIPAEVLKDFERPKRGRPPLTDEEKAARAKKRTAKTASAGLPFEPPAHQPAKLIRGATRKARAKKPAKKTSKKAGN